MSSLESLDPKSECVESEFEEYDTIEEIVKCENSLESQISISTPLYVNGAFGRSKPTSVVNLSANGRSLIAYSCSHLLIILDYVSREKKYWPGHRNLITSLSSDKCGKWLISSDCGHENFIIVWNFENFTPFCTFQPPATTYITKVSPCAKYIVSVSSEHYISTCYLWVISKEKKEASGSCSFDVKLGTVRSIAFSLDSSNHFMLTTNKTVLFFTWHNDNLIPGNLDVYIPSPLPREILENLMESVYLQFSSLCLTSTVDGYILVWNNEGSILKPKKDLPLTNEKILHKWYQLQKNGITVLRQVNEFVVTGDDLGVIRFYDYNLCLLYWTQGTNTPQNFVQIEFHLQPREYYFGKENTASSTDQFTDKALPIDCTREGNVFIVRDFIAVDRHGCVYYFDFLKNNCRIICEMPNSPITSMDCHPERTLITFSNSSGELTMINYITGEFICSKSISDFINEPDDVITCVKYSSRGDLIAVGMQRGAVFFVDSCLYEPAQKKPFTLSSTKILKICFSPDDAYMAYADEYNCVTLYGTRIAETKEGLDRQWICCGRVSFHYKRISDLKFDPNPTCRNRLFSIGLDHSLVEYSLELSENNGIGIITKDRIEQTAYPTSLNWSVDVCGERLLLTTNSEFKYKIYHQETKQYRHTFQGPVYDSPITYCQMLNHAAGDEMMVFGTDKVIGLQMYPLDSNPFKAMGVIAHPVKLVAIACSYNRKMVFTVGVNETCILKWDVNKRLMKTLCKQGGEGLEPYYLMIEGGEKGWLFNQAMDYFFWGQIIHEGHLWQDSQNISRFMKTCELANVMRCLGYYPTEQEIKDMLEEVSLNVYNSEKKESDTVSFEEFIHLYINHRPAKGITWEQMDSNFKILSQGGTVISKEKLHRVLEEEGETVNKADVSNFLQLLLEMSLNQKSERDDYSQTTTAKLSQDMTQAMIEELLGITKHGEDDKN